MDGKLVEEMVKSNRVIVRQLREMISKGLECSCPCHSLQSSVNDSKLQAIEDKLLESDIHIRAFSDKQKEHEAEIQKLKVDNDELHEKLKELSELIEQSCVENDVEIEGNDTLENVSELSEGATGYNYNNSDGSNDDKFNSVSIGQLNFSVERNHQQDDPTSPIATVERVIQSTVKTTREMDWRLKAQIERGMFPLTPRLNGTATVICLDISASMLENSAWNQAHQFITEYIQGLENMRETHGIFEEYIGLVTFGHSNEVVLKLTNRYDVFKQEFDDLKVGGPTPMFGGLVLTGPALSTGRDFYDVGGIPVYNKIILITDGYPTETSKIAGPDTVDKPENDEKIELDILEVCQQIRNINYEVYCVPCGNANGGFLSRLVKITNGRMIKHTDGEWLSRRFYLNIKTAKNQFDLYPGVTEELGETEDYEKEELAEILARSQRTQFERQQRLNIEIYRDSDDPNLPHVGSRVRIGPDWKRGDINQNKPGTVLGHSSTDKCIWVDWDEGGRLEHRYGCNGQYEVLIVDEPKILTDQFIMGVGCEVVKGPDWKSWHGQLEDGMKGTAIKLDLNKGVVQVKWRNGERGVYSYKGDQQVILADRLPSSQPTKTPVTTKSNTSKQKNKNMTTKH